MSKYYVTCGWDVPHLSDEDKKEMLSSIPLHQRDARTKGIPQIGSGAIYPIAEEDYLVQPFKIPQFYKRCYALDVGWKATAVLWLAHDAENDVIYVTGEYKRGQAEPSVHADAIKSRGEWIPGVIDPASAGSGQDDGKKLVEQYRGFGLNLSFANNAVETGIFEVYKRFTTGRLKIFMNCTELLSEIRLYRRDEKGKIVKDNDHLADCLRYGCLSGVGVAEYNVQDVMDSLENKIGKHTSHYNPLDRKYATDEITGGINKR